VRALGKSKHPKNKSSGCSNLYRLTESRWLYTRKNNFEDRTQCILHLHALLRHHHHDCYLLAAPQAMALSFSFMILMACSESAPIRAKSNQNWYKDHRRLQNKQLTLMNTRCTSQIASAGVVDCATSLSGAIRASKLRGLSNNDDWRPLADMASHHAFSKSGKDGLTSKILLLFTSGKGFWRLRFKVLQSTVLKSHFLTREGIGSLGSSGNNTRLAIQMTLQ